MPRPPAGARRGTFLCVVPAAAVGAAERDRRRSPDRRARGGYRRAGVGQAPYEYPPPATRRGTQDRRRQTREPRVSGRRVLSDAERRDWLRLTRSERVGPITFFHLLKRFGSAAAALDALPDLARRGGRAALRVPRAPAADREMAQNVKLGARLIARFEPDYPDALSALDDAPPPPAVRGQRD